jgi:hypothetical protein
MVVGYGPKIMQMGKAQNFHLVCRLEISLQLTNKTVHKTGETRYK